MAYGDALGKGGHNGLLVAVVTGSAVSLTGAEGATWNWGINTAEWGGFGHTTRRATTVMPGPASIEVADPAWDSADDTIHDLLDGMLAGTSYTFYLYPLGRVSTAKYLYGSFMLSDLEIDIPIDDVIKQPFSLVASGDVYRVGM